MNLSRLTKTLRRASASLCRRDARSTFEGDDQLTRLLVCSAEARIAQIRQIGNIGHLSEVELRVFSQNGEDGILQWLLSRLPDIPKSFIEFGVSNYEEANTRLLVERDCWRGLIIDSSSKNIESIKSRSYFWRNELHAVTDFVTAENINKIIADHGFEGAAGILSIDVDGIDYWILSALESVRPAILVCEYNALFGDVYPITVEYNPTFDRTIAHHSNLFFGASIAALISKANEKNYCFVGSDSRGVNAFFVDRAHWQAVEGRVAKREARMSRHRESRDREGKLTFITGLDRLGAIADMEVWRPDLQRRVALGHLAQPYSQAWLSQDGGRGDGAIADLGKRD